MRNRTNQTSAKGAKPSKIIGESKSAKSRSQKREAKDLSKSARDHITRIPVSCKRRYSKGQSAEDVGPAFVTSYGKKTKQRRAWKVSTESDATEPDSKVADWSEVFEDCDESEGDGSREEDCHYKRAYPKSAPQPEVNVESEDESTDDESDEDAPKLRGTERKFFMRGRKEDAYKCVRGNARDTKRETLTDGFWGLE